MGERRLIQGDPLPQTIYHTKATTGAPMMLRVPFADRAVIRCSGSA